MFVRCIHIFYIKILVEFILLIQLQWINKIQNKFFFRCQMEISIFCSYSTGICKNKQTHTQTHLYTYIYNIETAYCYVYISSKRCIKSKSCMASWSVVINENGIIFIIIIIITIIILILKCIYILIMIKMCGWNSSQYYYYYLLYYIYYVYSYKL